MIAAGSLLEFTLNDDSFSFPVGRVQFLYLKPLSFYEYLMSQKHDQLCGELREATLGKPLDPFFHKELLRLLREYFLIGGMPAAVQKFLDTHSFLESQRVLSGLLATYRADFPKYSTHAEHKHLQMFFDKAPGKDLFHST